LQRPLGSAAIALTRISQAPQFFVYLLKLFVALHILRFLLLIIGSQLIEHFADGELANFSHRGTPLGVVKIRLATKHHQATLDIARIDLTQTTHTRLWDPEGTFSQWY
jgi:hypothetical protein